MKYVLKKDFLGKKAGKEYYTDGYYNGSAYFNLGVIDPMLEGKEIGIRFYEKPDLFEAVPDADDEFMKKIDTEIQYGIKSDLQKFLDDSNILIGGIESPVFKNYVLSVVSILEETINKLENIKNINR